MNNKILAIKWGTGYRLLKYPYNSDECITWVNSCDLDKDLPELQIIKSNTEYNELKDIEYCKKIGIMNLIITNGKVVIKSSLSKDDYTKRPKPTKESRLRHMKFIDIYDNRINHKNLDNKYRATIDKKLKYTINEFITNPSNNIATKELMQYIANIKTITYVISNKLHIRPRSIWNILYTLGLKSDHFNMKLSILYHYCNGDIKCSNCGITDIRILTIDHINGGGTKHIKTLVDNGTNFYTWLIENDYPEGYQVLCMNCQWVKRHENNEFNRILL